MKFIVKYQKKAFFSKENKEMIVLANNEAEAVIAFYKAIVDDEVEKYLALAATNEWELLADLLGYYAYAELEGGAYQFYIEDIKECPSP